MREEALDLTPVVEALTAASALRDPSIASRAPRVRALTTRIARRLRLAPLLARDLRRAAELHDIGTVGIPDSLLVKPGPLGEEEWAVVRRHPEWGAGLLRDIPGLENVAHAVRHHHERYDGGGYPDGVAGEDIPIESRVLAAADAFAAMTEDRPYRRALSVEEARRELRAARKAQFDPRVVDALEFELEIERLNRAVCGR